MAWPKNLAGHWTHVDWLAPKFCPPGHRSHPRLNWTKCNSIQASDGVDCIVTPLVLVGWGRGTGQGRGQGRGRVQNYLNLPLAKGCFCTGIGITWWRWKQYQRQLRRPPNRQDGSWSPPANFVSISDNDEGILGQLRVLPPLVNLSTTSNTATSTLPAPLEPATVHMCMIPLIFDKAMRQDWVVCRLISARKSLYWVLLQIK